MVDGSVPWHESTHPLTLLLVRGRGIGEGEGGLIEDDVELIKKKTRQKVGLGGCAKRTELLFRT